MNTSILLGLSLMIMTILSGGAIAPALVATLSIGMATFCSCLTALVGKQTFDMAKQKIAEIKKSPGQQEQQYVLLPSFIFDPLSLRLDSRNSLHSARFFKYLFVSW